jgi:hypothetical protein
MTHLSAARSVAMPIQSWSFLLLGVVLVGAVLWAATAPITSSTNEALFEIPKSTWARRMAGRDVEILPARIALTLGVQNVLVLTNNDDVPQVFGPALLMPGQSFRLPFEVASSYQFTCSAHASGQMRVDVTPFPASPWARVRWRANALLMALGLQLP